MIPIYSRSPDPATVNYEVLSRFFRSEAGERGRTFLHRTNQGPSRGFLRLLFPRFLLKITPREGANPRYQLKPDAWASLMFFVFVAVGIGWIVDPGGAEGNPTWLPWVFAAWFVLLAVREVAYTKRALDLATSGVPLPTSTNTTGGKASVADQVLAMLEAEEAETLKSESGDDSDGD